MIILGRLFNRLSKVDRHQIRYSAALGLMCGFLCLGGCYAPRAGVVRQPFTPATPTSIVAVTKEIFPAVVRLDIVKTEYEDGKPTVKREIGTGVIIDGNGHILTNFHVAGQASEINVTLFSKERVRGKLIGDDHWTDLAVVQMDMDEARSKHVQFSVAPFGDSSRLMPGQDVMAVGTPFGLARTMTLGSISTLDRTFYPQQLMIGDYETGRYSNWIQMDVPINPGNSGGPLVDLDGRIVGINTRGGAQNVNFAVPIDTAKPIGAAILKTASPQGLGRFDRSDLGLELQPMQDLEILYNLEADKGVLIGDVQQFSGAVAAGVQAQDVLLAINGRPTNARFPEELAGIHQMIAALPRDLPATLLLQRGHQQITLAATPHLLQGVRGEEKTYNSWGMSLREVTPRYASLHRLPAVEGAIVNSVTPESFAATGDLQIGDVIVAINGKKVSNLAAFDQIQSAGSSDPSSSPNILFTVLRGNGTRSLLLKVPAADSTQSSSPAN